MPGRCDTFHVWGLNPHARRRVRSLRFWRWSSPGPNRILYSVRSGAREYRRKGSCLEPFWLRFLNRANNMVCVNTSHKSVRFYVRYFLRSKAELGSGLWLNIVELRHLEDVHERLQRGEFISSQLSRRSERTEESLLSSWEASSQPVCEETHTPSPLEGKRLESLFQSGPGQVAKASTVRKLQTLLNKVNQEAVWNRLIPNWHWSIHQYPLWIIRSRVSKLKKFRHRVLSFLVRVHYILYYVVGVDIGLPHILESTASKIRRSKSDLSSHLLMQASLAPDWRPAANRLYQRLKVLLFP